MRSRRVERATEDRAVADLLARAQEEPAGLVVEGEAGIGKTTLMLAAADKAKSLGFHVLSAQGSPAEVGYAYAAVADLVRDVDTAIAAALPDVQRVALERACIGDVGDGGPATDERMVATALLSVIERLSASAPVLVVVDDAQWLDASSRAAIGFTARRLAGAVGMMLSFRTGDPDSADERSWLQFRRPEAIARVGMRPLSLGALHGLIAARLGRTLPRPTVTRIYEISGGNPLFAVELAAAAASDMAAPIVELPDNLAALVRRRIRDVGDDAAAVLLIAACSVEPTVESIAGAADVTPARVVELLESIDELHLVTVDGSRVRFTHPLFANGVYTDAAPSRRRAVHRTLAAVVDRPELKARHLALGAPTGDATTLAALDAAAETTAAQGAPAVAAELLELALKYDGENAVRRVRAGEMHIRAGSLAEAARHLQAALRGAPPGMLRCTALMLLGAAKAYGDDMGGAVAAMSDAVDEAGDQPALRLLCLLRLSLMLAMTDRLGEGMVYAEQALELADQLGVPGLRSQALSNWVLGKYLSGRGIDDQALQKALELEDPHSGATTTFQASAAQAMISAYSGDLDRAADQMRAVRQRMSDGGTEIDIIWAAVHTAAIAVWSGRYAEAAEAVQDALPRAEQMGGLLLVTAWNQQAAIAAYSGREDEARRTVRASIDRACGIGAVTAAREPTNYLAFLEVSLGNYAAALTVLHPQLDNFDAVITEIEGGLHLPDGIEALCALGRADEAEPLIAALEHNGTRLDRPWMLAVGARGRSHLLAARGDLEAAEHAAHEALKHHERLPMPFEKARTQLFLGQVQRRRRRRQAAEATLRAALETFEQLGAPLWAQRARAELARLATVAQSVGLTAAERRVAEHAAAGLSNKQIAAELFIAPKTVEMTLSRVYRKLGIPSRAGLYAALNTE